MLHVRGDRIVGELLHEARLPVVLEAGGDERIERAVQRRVRRRTDELCDHGRHIVERFEHLLTLLDGARPAADEGDERVPVTILRDERKRWSDLERREHPHLSWGVGDVVAIELQDGLDLAQLEEHRAAVDVVHGMEAKLEEGRDTEVPAAPAERPEQVFVLTFARDESSSVGRHHVG